MMPRSHSQSHLRLREERKWRRDIMSRTPLLLGLAIVLVLGIAVYFRLWSIDSQISAHDTALLRRQFDLAHREAVDESAEWRLRFDEERDRATKCMKELAEVKASLGEQTKDTPTLQKRFEILQKDNKYLLERLELLKQELQAEKLKCKAQ